MEEARSMPWWDFTAMRWHWNERHKSSEDRDNGDPVEMPDLEFVKRRGDMLEARGIVGSIH